MVAKRIFDILFSLAALIFGSPFFLFVAVLVKLTSPGEVFYRGPRVGQFGKMFHVLKFRTMYQDADTMKQRPRSEWNTTEDDIRVTPLGYFLRKYKINELAQFWNVLIGDMSVVGPRPEAEKYVKMYKEEEKVILEMKPGITDFASVHFSNKEEIFSTGEDPEEIYVEVVRPEKIRRQLHYYRVRNFWVDLTIIISTCKVLFKLGARR